MEKPKNKKSENKIHNSEDKKKIDLLQYNLQKVREKVWKMQKSEDLIEVAIAIKESLEDQGIPFENCGINVVDISEEPLEVYSYNLIEKGEWTSRIDKKEKDIITGLWRGGETVYRRDLEKKDIYGEKEPVSGFLPVMALSKRAAAASVYTANRDRELRLKSISRIPPERRRMFCLVKNIAGYRVVLRQLLLWKMNRRCSEW